MTEKTPTNKERAMDALEALDAWKGTKGDLNGQTDEENITDMVADLLHYATHKGVEVEYVLRNAKMHFESETEEEA